MYLGWDSMDMLYFGRMGLWTQVREWFNKQSSTTRFIIGAILAVTFLTQWKFVVGVLIFGAVVAAVLMYMRYTKVIGPSVSQKKPAAPEPEVHIPPFIDKLKEAVSAKKSPPPITIKPMNAARIVLGILALIILISVGTRTFVVVPAGAVGVYSLFGKVSANELDSGLHLINPLGRVDKMSVRTEQYTMSASQNEGARLGDDSIDALTKEGLTLKLDITVLYNLEKDKASDVFIALGKNYPEKIIRPEVRSSIRNIIAQYDANAVYTEKREDVILALTNNLKATLVKRGIVLQDVLLRNVALPAKLADSIQEKLQADQEAQRYDFILEKEKKEADRKRIEAAGQRDSQQIIAEGLTPNYLNYLYIQNLKDNKGTIYVPTSPTTGLPLFKGL